MRVILGGALNAARCAFGALGRLRGKLARSLLIIALAGGVILGGYHICRATSGAGHIIRKVEARVTVGEESATVRLSFDVAGPGFMREARVPVLPPGVSLVEARLDGKEAELDLIGDRPAVLVKGRARRRAELVYALPLPEERRLTLALPRGIRTSVEVELASPGMTVKCAPPAVVEMLPAEERTLARIITPPLDALLIAWFPKPEKVSTPVRTGARTETLYTIQGDSLCGRTVYSLRVQGEDVSRFTFELPEGVSIDQLEGSWLEGWDVSGGKLSVQAKAALTGQVVMTIHHRRALSEGKVGLEVPALENAVRQWGFGAVAAGGAVELKALKVENGCEIDPRGLPASLRSAGSAPVARAFRYDGVPSKQELELVRHEEMETLEATADSLNALLVHTPDGRAIGRMVYSVRNVRRQHVLVTMPPGTELWSVYVAGNPVRPSKADDGKLLIPLSCSAATARRAFPVELVYFAQGAAFGDKGRFSAALPEVDIPVMQVMLSVSVPEEITLEDFAGDLKAVESFAFSLAEEDMKLVREAGRAKPEDIDVQDANRQLDELVRRGAKGQVKLRLGYGALVRNPEFQRALRYNFDNDAFITQYYLENAGQFGQEARVAPRLNLTGFGQAELAEITGLASLKVAVPAGGRVLRFERQLLLKEGASVEADYWSSLAARADRDNELRLDSDVAALYRLSPRGVKLTARLDYRLESGKIDGLTFELPAGTKVLSLKGANVAVWETEELALKVRLVRPERNGGRLILSAEFDGELALAPPRLVGARCEEVILAVAAPHNYELRFPDLERLERVAPSALPEELRGLFDGRTRPKVFRLAQTGPAAVRVEAVVHRKLTGLEATCDSVNAISFYTEEGVCVTRAIFEIRNVGERHLVLSLPEGSELWGAFVADRAVKALAGEGEETLIPLPCPSAGEIRSLPVEVVYIRTGKPFERKGRLQAELPKLDVPVMHAMYSVYLPKKLRLGRFGGELKRVREFSAPVAPRAVSRDRAVPKRALRALKQQSLQRYNDRQAALEWNVSQRAAREVLGRAAGGTRERSNDAEALPACALKIYIPGVGQLVRFERHLIVEGKMSVACSYRS